MHRTQTIILTDKLPVFVAKPEGDGPWPGVVVVHDALGMTEDLRNQAIWLAEAGYLTIAPDLFYRGSRIRCLIKAMREMASGVEGETYNMISIVRQWILDNPHSTGSIGIIGFCFGGGFALMLAPSDSYNASAVNYGGMTDSAWEKMVDACPIVASYGSSDPTLKGMAEKLKVSLDAHNVPNDVKEYVGVGHGFMNKHGPEDSNFLFSFLAKISNTRYDKNATMDARRRIIAFFDKYLGKSV